MIGLKSHFQISCLNNKPHNVRKYRVLIKSLICLTVIELAGVPPSIEVY
jgi:hypothetical protein